MTVTGWEQLYVDYRTTTTTRNHVDDDDDEPPRDLNKRSLFSLISRIHNERYHLHGKQDLSQNKYLLI